MATKSKVIELINKEIFPYYVTSEYTESMDSWVKNSNLKTIKKAIAIGKESYLKYDKYEVLDESVDTFLDKLGGIVHNLEMPPIENKINYIVNTLNYVFGCSNKRYYIDLVNSYVDELKKDEKNTEEIILDKLNNEKKNISNFSNIVEWEEYFKQLIDNQKVKFKTISDLKHYLMENGLETKFGKIDNIKSKIGQGGNSIVCFGDLNGEEVAIKFLVKYDRNKVNRFYLEYFNIVKSVTNYDGIVHQYFLDELIKDNNIYPYIVMKKYKSQLEYKEDIKLMNYILLYVK